jgi:hypothetical protein
MWAFSFPSAATHFDHRPNVRSRLEAGHGAGAAAVEREADSDQFWRSVPATSFTTMRNMLGMKSYPQIYIDACRARVDAQVATYRKMVASGDVQESFESVFFNNMVVVLDSYFTHRLRGVEGKDGNPLNEVRVLTSSMLENNDTMAAENTIKMSPATSVLGYKVGDPIRVTEQDFVRLAEAFFAGIESKFAE